MIKVFTAAGWIIPSRRSAWAGLIALVALSVSGSPFARAWAQDAAPPADAQEAEPQPQVPAEAEEPEELVDPSETHKSAALEVFKDPNAELALDVKKYPEIRANRMPSPQEIAQVKEMAGSPLVNVDPNVITNVVNGMIAQLTNSRNIQAAIDPNDKTNPNSSTARAVQEATQNLLEPIFMARAAKNVQFQTRYNQILLQRLTPVLKHHLVPRIQAAIVLAQSGNPEALKTFLDEIQNPGQTVWVKLWAFRGITIIESQSNRLSTAQEADAAKIISDQLAANKNWPWPVQLRALEALGALRQGFLPTSPRTADMAATIFQFLIDENLEPDVRAEAAKALGALRITTAVPKYNFELAAYATAQYGAFLGENILDLASDDKLYAQKLTTLLVGPVFQALEGNPADRDSGLLRNPSLANRDEVQKYLDAMRPMSKAATALMTAPTGQIPARTNELSAAVTAFKDFLAKTPPADNHLFTGGPEYAAPAAPAQAEAAPAPADDASAAKPNALAGASGGR